MKNKINVAFIYKPSDIFLAGNHFDNTTYYFFMEALKRNESLEISYFKEEHSMDILKIKDSVDAIIIPGNHSMNVPNLHGINESKIPVIARTGDFHNAKKYNTFQFHKKFKIDYYFNFMSSDYFYKFYPKDFKYKEIVFGVEPSLYENLIPFEDRIKDKILNSGAIGKNEFISKIANRILNPKSSGWYYYKLRTLCNELEYVVHTGMIKGKYVNDEYPKLLSRYKAAIAATTYYPTLKYLETTAAGCLTFMEITEENNGEYLGFKDYESSIFINEINYKDKFEEFLKNPNEDRWTNIAKKGTEHTLKNFNNDTAVESLVSLIKELI
ncbi:MAG: hypothetical protein CXT78_01005 [Thaumarchaeota archaeon]|jgi:hypothetical protein|nr:MAG: hypothetical protein CXT78_01005 [Nitrososphaerota archaeon]